METIITIIICIVLLCIIPSIGTRHPRGYQPRVEPDLDKFPYKSLPGSYLLPYRPNALGGSISSEQTKQQVDEETIRRIVREEMAKQNDDSSTGIAFDHRLINRSDY